MGDQVRAEAHAVRRLRSSVSAYSQVLRGCVQDSAADAARLTRRTEEAVQTRQREHARAIEGLVRAKEAAARSKDGGAARAVAAAEALVRETAERAKRAQRAAQIAADMRRSLASTSSTVTAAVGEHESVAFKALADLESRLVEITGDSFLAGVRKTATALHIAAEIAIQVAGAGKAVGPVATGVLADFDAHETISQKVDDATGEAQQLWRDGREVSWDRGDRS